LKKLIIYSIVFIFGCIEKNNNRNANYNNNDVIWNNISYTISNYAFEKEQAKLDYIRAYSLTCDSFPYKENGDYTIVENRLLYNLKNNVYNSIFSYEVIQPKSKKEFDQIIYKLKNQFCTPRPEDRLDYLYLINDKFIICVHADNADIKSFEDTILFQKNTFAKIKVRNDNRE
jgi:hypothetical protein